MMLWLQKSDRWKPESLYRIRFVISLWSVPVTVRQCRTHDSLLLCILNEKALKKKDLAERSAQSWVKAVNPWLHAVDTLVSLLASKHHRNVTDALMPLCHFPETCGAVCVLVYLWVCWWNDNTCSGSTFPNLQPNHFATPVTENVLLELLRWRWHWLRPLLLLVVENYMLW